MPNRPPRRPIPSRPLRLLLLGLFLLTGACSYSENGGQYWNRVQVVRQGPISERSGG